MADANENNAAAGGSEEQEHDPHFEPVIKLTDEVKTSTGEEDEDVLFKMRAKLFRFDNGEWKERGTGDMRLLQHKQIKKVRVVMRRDKTLKVCANHYVTSDMTLTPNVGSDRSWVWTATEADEETGEAKHELLAVRFGTSENANLFKTAFQKAQKINAGEETEAAATTDDVARTAEVPQTDATASAIAAEIIDSKKTAEEVEPTTDKTADATEGQLAETQEIKDDAKAAGKSDEAVAEAVEAGHS
ncbi:uncharacterized protein L969DRAFT_17494 [Mixia osmundae IAM 14324]|uniref:RanBD1 domain-containing protein n=1 Tax=Mixia osmundae (strain CBS 9802 / IAM 14324 / JCM 22182 / KY 12970) TaxID=764103 RepID=G7DVY5_MIXOS|nr:uncharacterized protein L969DRAFT_17494 [Mixia osmundae IAM 14324]KEI39574.1 hypothetical protein L969DRAFT_17494 [Mixia osmundae IAM 14324]GAA94745.1 hypothetical protein E5Q_01399 [Mixia osmundae IAM 14324]